MNFVLIAAMDKNRAIGKDGGIPWHIPKDFAWFKEQTMHQTVLMGRKCYQDIIKYTKGKPLPGRKNLVLTTQGITAEGFNFYNSIEQAIEDSKANGEQIIFIIGGAQLYNEFVNNPNTSKIILTRIDTEIVGADTFFPEVPKGFIQTFEKKDSDDKFSFTFEIYERK